MFSKKLTNYIYMTEKVRSALLELLRGILACVVAFVTAICASSCGSTTRAVISNRAEQTQTTVTITTNNPTEWNVSPDTNVDMSKTR